MKFPRTNPAKTAPLEGFPSSTCAQCAGVQPVYYLKILGYDEGMLPSGAAEWIALTFLERRARNSRVAADGDAVSRLVSLACHLQRRHGDLRELRQILELSQNLNVRLSDRQLLAHKFGWTKNHFKQTQRRLVRLRDELFPSTHDFTELRNSYRHLLETKPVEADDSALLAEAHAQATQWHRGIPKK
jgi:hypothetical protein